MFNSNRQTNLSTTDRQCKALMLTVIIVGVLSFLLCLGTAANAQSSGRFTIEQVGDALNSYGKNTVDNNGHVYYTVSCGHDSWKSSVVVSLSPNSSVIWLDLDLVEVPANLSPAAMANLLKKNSDLGPVFFAIANNWLRISMPLANNDMSEAKLKANLERLVHVAVDNHDAWDPNVLAVAPTGTHASATHSSMQRKVEEFDRSLQVR
jgi:hypothetical protein